MENYNYKVVAKLRDDLSEEERKFIHSEIDKLAEKMGVENVGNNTFCKKPPVIEHNDFGPVGFFFIELREFKNSFSKLEYYDTWGERNIAV